MPPAGLTTSCWPKTGASSPLYITAPSIPINVASGAQGTVILNLSLDNGALVPGALSETTKASIRALVGQIVADNNLAGMGV